MDGQYSSCFLFVQSLITFLATLLQGILPEAKQQGCEK
jgi:hypothetical protein